ncbi:hypothetical protein FOA52_011276 [Chlamydomonas sp. UWO 241]|nr:hypothetical protein FOA52_011276 [Chlamydomonas sp. UWO 241]
MLAGRHGAMLPTSGSRCGSVARSQAALQGWRHDVARVAKHQRPCRPAAQQAELRGNPSPGVLRYKDEIALNLSAYMVELDKPLGLTLAPDPATGQIVVQAIKENSPAANCHLIQVGDVVKKCSAVFGDDMWQAVDIRRMRWAIKNRTAKVKLVLERAARPLSAAPVWYTKGQAGRASFEREVLQLPVSFVSTGGVDHDWPADMVSQGKPMTVGFHRSSPASLSSLWGMRPAAARQTRLQGLREELASASSQATLELKAEPVGRRGRAARLSVLGLECVTGSLPSTSGAVPSTSTPAGAPVSAQGPGAAQGNASSSPSSGRSSAGSSASTNTSGPPPAPPKKTVLPFLPWLLLTNGRLDTRELTQLATARGLGALLELSLAPSQGGHLALRGAEASMQRAELNVSSLMDGSDGRGGADPQGSGQSPANGTQALSGRHVVARSPLVGREQEIALLIQAASCLQRLRVRRLGSSLHHSSKERCSVLLHCESGLDAKCGNLLAGWLHWYCHMPLQEAILSAELATGTVVQQSLLEGATEQLIRTSEDRLNKVTVTWKYGAQSVGVAGDIVGGWQNRVALHCCRHTSGCQGSTGKGQFILPLTGLRPGVYYYKFIVDGTWTVDPSAPKVIDVSGNYNNVLEVHARPPSITTRDRLQAARWQAAHIALESKMMPAHG